MRKYLLFSIILIIPLLLGNKPIDINKASRDDLKKAFDVIIQNYGALEFAYYTFTLENERPPENFNELKNSGHLMVIMKDPYTGKDALVVDSETDAKAGNLLYRKTSKNEAAFACYYANPNEPTNTRSLRAAIKIYTHKALKEAVFMDDATREEQMTRVYLLQLDDAIESFRQKVGRMPDSLKELADKGDVNVNYINPFTKMPAIQSEKLSPGDYFYRKFTRKVKQNVPKRQADGSVIPVEIDKDEEFYEVIGWGKTKPVYYYSNDWTREELDWDEQNPEQNILNIMEGYKPDTED